MQENCQQLTASERDFMEEFTDYEKYRSEKPPLVASALNEFARCGESRSETPASEASIIDEFTNYGEYRSETPPYVAIAIEEFSNNEVYPSEIPPSTAMTMDEFTNDELSRAETPAPEAITTDEVTNDGVSRVETALFAAITADDSVSDADCHPEIPSPAVITSTSLQESILPQHFVAIASSLPWVCSMSMLTPRDKTKAQRFLINALNERKVKKDWSVDMIPANFRRGLDEIFRQFTTSPVACESVITFMIEKLLCKLEAEGEPIAIEDHAESALFKAQLDGLSSLDEARLMIMEQLSKHLQIRDAMTARAAALAIVNSNIQKTVQARADASAAISASQTSQFLQKQLNAAKVQIEELRTQKRDLEKMVGSLGSNPEIAALRREKQEMEKLASSFCERNTQLETAVLALHEYQIEMAQTLHMTPHPLTMFDPCAEFYFPGARFLGKVRPDMVQHHDVDQGDVELDAVLQHNAQHVGAPQSNVQQGTIQRESVQPGSTPQKPVQEEVIQHHDFDLDFDQDDILLDTLLQYDAQHESGQLETTPQKSLPQQVVQQQTPPQETQQQQSAQQVHVPRQNMPQQVVPQDTRHQGFQQQGGQRSASRSQNFHGQGFQQKSTFLGFHVPQTSIQIMSPPQLGQYIQPETAVQRANAPEDYSQQDPFLSYNTPHKNTQQLSPQPNQYMGFGFSNQDPQRGVHMSQASRGFTTPQLANASGYPSTPYAQAAFRTPAATPKHSPPSSKKRKAEVLGQSKTDYFLCTMETKKNSGITCNGINYTYRTKGQELIEREKCCKCARNTWAQHKIYVSEDWVCGMGGVTPSTRSASRKGSAGSSTASSTLRSVADTPTRPAKSRKVWAGSSAAGMSAAGSSVASTPRQRMVANTPVPVQQVLQARAPPPVYQQEEVGPAKVYKPNHMIRGAAAGALSFPSMG